jgi:hypothetical protein
LQRISPEISTSLQKYGAAAKIRVSNRIRH